MKIPIKNQSEARNGGKLTNQKDEQDDHTPLSNRVSVGVKKGLGGKLVPTGGSKVRSDSKESSKSKNDDSKKEQ